jgi:hypothetical protein
MQADYIYEQGLESQLRVSDAQISQLTAKLKNADEDMTFIYIQQLDDIRSNQRELTLMLKLLNKSDQNTQRSLRKKLNYFLHDLRTDMGHTIYKFRYKSSGKWRPNGNLLHRFRSSMAEVFNGTTR